MFAGAEDIIFPTSPLPGRAMLRYSVESMSPGPNEQIRLFLGAAFRQVP